MMSASTIGVVILAAGASSRLGRPKQLVKHQGKCLLQHVVDCCTAFDFGSKSMVLGAESETILQKTNTRDFKMVINNRWTEGISSSIHMGIKDVIANDQIGHVLFLLSDQPFVSSQLIEQLIQTHQKLTACRYSGNMGVPAAFSRHYFQDLLALTGDKGAKAVLNKHQSIVRLINFQKGDIDIDTEADLANLDQLKPTLTT